MIYNNNYRGFSEMRIHKKIILGDSRLTYIDFEEYDNFSIPGVTLAKMIENIDIIFNEIPEKVVISLGVNDVLNGYTTTAIKENISVLIKFLLTKNIELVFTNIVYTNINIRCVNFGILELNNFIEKICEKYNIIFIDLNEKLSEDCKLRAKYTTDGLHFNQDGEKILIDILHKGIY